MTLQSEMNVQMNIFREQVRDLPEIHPNVDIDAGFFL